MKVTVKKLPKSRVELTIEVPVDVMAGFFDTAYQNLGQQVEIKGFRKGKAPKSIVLEQVGEDRLNAAAVDLALPKTYYDAVTGEQLVPIAEPEVHVEKISETDGMTYRVEVDVLPEVETGNYRSVRVSRKKFAPKPVDQAAIDEQIMRLRKASATPKSVERAAQTGDFVEVSYTGKVGGVAQDSLASKNHPLVLGENTVLPAFEEQILGMKAGEEKTFTIEISGKDDKKALVEFTATMERVAELEIPELTDELVKKFGKDSAEQVRTELREQFEKDAADEAKFALEAAVLEEVTKLAKMELPDGLVSREIAHRMEMLAEQLQRSGQSMDAFLKSQKKTLEEFRKDLTPAAEQSVKTGLVLRAIAENENMLDKPKDDDGQEQSLRKVVDFLVEMATK